jgi:membrane associated rhomboid family serine protease
MFPISDNTPSRRFPFINLAIIGFTCYVFYLQLTSGDPEGFIYQYALIPAGIDWADYLTWVPFLTSIFLHGGLLHILSNMWFLWVFGDNVEGHLPPFFYLIFYLFCGVAGGLTQYFLAPGSDIPMLGASGAIAGILGAYLRLFPHHKVKTLFPVFGFFTIANISAGFILLYWFVLQLISGATSLGGLDQGGVAFWAHIGGFVAGFLFIKPFAYKESVIEFNDRFLANRMVSKQS